jgi:kynurenine formamidase
MEEAERKSGVKVDGHIVLLCTGFHARNWGDRQRIVWGNPGLTVEATRWLYDRGSRMHGVEGPSTDKPSDNIFAQHRLCRDLGISHFEWLVNLEELVGAGEFEFFGLPLKFRAAPVLPSARSPSCRKATTAGPRTPCDAPERRFAGQAVFRPAARRSCPFPVSSPHRLTR